MPIPFTHSKQNTFGGTKTDPCVVTCVHGTPISFTMYKVVGLASVYNKGKKTYVAIEDNVEMFNKRFRLSLGKLVGSKVSFHQEETAPSQKASGCGRTSGH